MPMYAIATIPLIKSLNQNLSQVWYADDATAVGKISTLRDWRDQIVARGPSYGYHANASKLGSLPRNNISLMLLPPLQILMLKLLLRGSHTLELLLVHKSICGVLRC